MLVQNISELIGNTPIIEIPSSVSGLKQIKLYAKLENMNPFGSIKDRIALHMLNGVIDQITNNQTVIESSSGNTAKALSLLCTSKGIDFKAVTNRIKFDEVREILQTIGSQLEELPGYSDCADLFDPNDAIQYTKNLVNTRPDLYVHTDQYFNPENPFSHEQTTAKEINIDLGKVDFLFGFLGTCGSTIGTGKGLREYNPKCKVFGVTSKPGHSIPGGRNMGELHEVGFFKKDFYDDFLPGTVDESIDGMLSLAKDLGILGGPTSGLLFHKACSHLRTLEQEKPDSYANHKAVFFICDRLEPYLGYLKKNRPSIFQSDKLKEEQLGLSDEHIENCPTIEPEELNIVKQNCIIIDIRGSFAFSLGHVPNSINIHEGMLEDMLKGSSCFSKNQQVVVVCRQGDTSRKYASMINISGNQAVSLSGGFQAFKSRGYEIEKFSLNKKSALSTTQHESNIQLNDVT